MADRLAKFESDARLRVTIVTIVCAVALFVEFMLTVTLPVALPGSFGQFLFFERVRCARGGVTATRTRR